MGLWGKTCSSWQYAGRERAVICASDVSAAAAARPTPDVPIFEYRPGVGFVSRRGFPHGGGNGERAIRIPAAHCRLGRIRWITGSPSISSRTASLPIWVKLDGRAAPDVVLAVDGLRIATHVEGDTLSAVMPDQFFEKPGTHQLRLQVMREATWRCSSPVAFVVR